MHVSLILGPIVNLRSTWTPERLEQNIGGPRLFSSLLSSQFFSSSVFCALVKNFHVIFHVIFFLITTSSIKSQCPCNLSVQSSAVQLLNNVNWHFINFLLFFCCHAECKHCIPVFNCPVCCPCYRRKCPNSSSSKRCSFVQRKLYAAQKGPSRCPHFVSHVQVFMITSISGRADQESVYVFISTGWRTIKKGHCECSVDTTHSCPFLCKKTQTRSLWERFSQFFTWGTGTVSPSILLSGFNLWRKKSAIVTVRAFCKQRSHTAWANLQTKLSRWCKVAVLQEPITHRCLGGSVCHSQGAAFKPNWCAKTKSVCLVYKWCEPQHKWAPQFCVMDRYEEAADLSGTQEACKQPLRLHLWLDRSTCQRVM